MSNLIYKHFNNDWKEIVTKIKDSNNQQLILEILKLDAKKEIYRKKLEERDWKYICTELEKILSETKLYNQKRLLTVLVSKDIVFNNWNELDIYLKGFETGKEIGYKEGYLDNKSGKKNKITEKKKNLTPIRATEQLTNERIRNWILGNYDSLEEAQADCDYTSQTEAYLNLISGRNVFLTGPAGSGKSFVINQYANMLSALNPKINIIKTSTTGISATNISGITIHSYLSCSPEDYNRPYEEVKSEYLNRAEKRWRNGDKKLKNADVVIIDEISMMSKAFFNFFAERYKDVRSKAQVIVCGDFSQLPPVAKKESIEKYGKEISEFCFDSVGWKELDLKVCYLDKLYRTKDEKLAFILNEISLGRGDTEKVIQELLKLPQTKDKYVPGSALILSTNANVDKINSEEQDKNPNSAKTFVPKILPQLVNDTTLNDKEKIENCQNLMIENKVPNEISLKENDTVMITSNLYEKDFDADSNTNELILANGTIGIFIYDEEEERFGIQLKNKTKIYIPEKIVTKSYMEEISRGKWEEIVTAAYKTLPMKLAYAITIHKSQGQSFSNVTCDLTNTFIEGLGYVALSRAQEYDGITLLNKNNNMIPFNKKALGIDPQSLEVKIKTQKQALGNRETSVIMLQGALENPLHYMNTRFKNKIKKAQILGD